MGRMWRALDRAEKRVRAAWRASWPRVEFRIDDHPWCGDGDGVSVKCVLRTTSIKQVNRYRAAIHRLWYAELGRVHFDDFGVCMELSVLVGLDRDERGRLIAAPLGVSREDVEAAARRGLETLTSQNPSIKSKITKVDVEVRDGIYGTPRANVSVLTTLRSEVAAALGGGLRREIEALGVGMNRRRHCFLMVHGYGRAFSRELLACGDE